MRQIYFNGCYTATDSTKAPMLRSYGANIGDASLNCAETETYNEHTFCNTHRS